MTNISRNILVALVSGTLIAGVSGCKKEGQMERSGKEMDKAAEKSGKQINKVIKNTGDKIEKAGDKIKNSVK